MRSDRQRPIARHARPRGSVAGGPGFEPRGPSRGERFSRPFARNRVTSGNGPRMTMGAASDMLPSLARPVHPDRGEGGQGPPRAGSATDPRASPAPIRPRTCRPGKPSPRRDSRHPEGTRRRGSRRSCRRPARRGCRMRPTPETCPRGDPQGHRVCRYGGVRQGKLVEDDEPTGGRLAHGGEGAHVGEPVPRLGPERVARDRNPHLLAGGAQSSWLPSAAP